MAQKMTPGSGVIVRVVRIRIEKFSAPPHSVPKMIRLCHSSNSSRRVVGGEKIHGNFLFVAHQDTSPGHELLEGRPSAILDKAPGKIRAFFEVGHLWFCLWEGFQFEFGSASGGREFFTEAPSDFEYLLKQPRFCLAVFEDGLQGGSHPVRGRPPKGRCVRAGILQASRVRSV